MTTIDLQATIDALGLTYLPTFRPTPQAGEKHPQLNWLITLEKGKQRMSFDYHQGIAHVEGYQHSHKSSWDRRKAEACYRATCETGKLHKTLAHCADPYETAKRQPAPKLADVLYCLVSDSDVLNYSSYEEWGPELGYDVDSRKGEETYRLCLKQSLAFRKLIGHAAIEQLKEAFQDY